MTGIHDRHGLPERRAPDDGRGGATQRGVAAPTEGPMTYHVIEAAGLTKYYGSRRGVVDVDVTVAEGEAFGFLGPNGAGKTTTIRLIMGFLRATRGEVRVFGEHAFDQAPRIHENVSYLGTDPGYLGELTGADQLDYLATMRGLPRGTWRSLAERLEFDPTVRIKRLSRGNRQKIGVIAAFMGHAPLLVLDEPTSGLDPLMQREFLALAAEARADGRTMFLSSHNLIEVERACDRVAIIRDGRIVDVSSVGELLGAHWRSINLVLASPPAADAFDLPNVEVAAMTGREVHLMVRGDVNPLLARIAAHEVHDIAITTPDVEDLFLRYYREDDSGSTRHSFDTGAAAGTGSGAAAGNGSRTPAETTREEVSR
jgi:ABC-2 type transport system ATP-binding protein